MTLRLLPAALLGALLLSGAAFAQTAAPADPHVGHDMAEPAAALPAACTPAGAAEAPAMAMESPATGELDPVRAGNRAAMEAMHGPMMQAAGIADADLAFNCGMIAHHRGAIAMAKVELAHGRDAASRKLAEAIIAAQEAEIAAMTAWVEARAK